MRILYTVAPMEQGFSLVELLIGISMLVGLGMAASSLYLSHYNAHGEIGQLDELDTFHKSLTRHMQVLSNCNSTLKNWEGSTIVPQGEISRLYRCMSNCTDDKIAFEVTPENNPFITAVVANPTDGSQWINDKRKWEVTEITATPPSTKTGILNLNIKYTLEPNKKGSKIVNKSLPLNVKFTATSPHRFITCTSDKGENVMNLLLDMCETLGNDSLNGQMVRWDDAIQYCVLQKEPILKCADAHEQVVWIDERGDAVCVSMTRNMDTSEFYEPIDADCSLEKRPRIRVENSKVRVECL